MAWNHYQLKCIHYQKRGMRDLFAWLSFQANLSLNTSRTLLQHIAPQNWILDVSNNERTLIWRLKKLRDSKVQILEKHVHDQLWIFKLIKVQIFWEAHKNLSHLPLIIWRYYSDLPNNRAANFIPMIGIW